MRFTHIRQSTPTGCGIACLAMVANAKLSDATKLYSETYNLTTHEPNGLT